MSLQPASSAQRWPNSWVRNPRSKSRKTSAASSRLWIWGMCWSALRRSQDDCRSVTYDCLIVGGGPAGLSGALMLGRCRRSVLVCDTGAPRNEESSGLHGFLTRDGIHPSEFLQLARDEVRQYPSVEFHRGEVVEARRTPGGFTAICAGGLQFSARKLLLATGVVDELPEIDGLVDLYGKSVHHCPYCDGW